MSTITTYAGIRNENKQVVALFFVDSEDKLVGLQRWSIVGLRVISHSPWRGIREMRAAWKVDGTYSLVKLEDKIPELLLDAIQEIALDTLEKEGTV